MEFMQILVNDHFQTPPFSKLLCVPDIPSLHVLIWCVYLMPVDIRRHLQPARPKSHLYLCYIRSRAHLYRERVAHSISEIYVCLV